MLPESAASRTERKANFKLSDSGDLEGKLTVTFSGLEAMSRRVEELHSDDAERKKYLEEQIKEYIPAACETDLTNQPDWKSSSLPLVAEFNVKIPGWVSGAGRRALLPVGIFSATEKHIFEHTGRVHPIYFQFPFEKIDDITIQLPASWQVQNLPAPRNTDGHIVAYTLKTDKDANSLHLKRTMKIDILLLEVKYYSALRDFFQVVRTGDEEQIILQPGAANASN